ncbi:MAG: helix-turn-helix transcriptional regulator [Carnobacterium inhibens]|uniref:helix-turn-helix transcriptional regulator n=1 Tax=Solibacillus sp. FSL R7-0682 TaxID=2921690 RepID=UPI0030F8C6F9
MLDNQISIWRAHKKMTQDQLAKEVGVTRQTIVALEKNKYNPSLDLAFRISKVLGKQIDEVFTHISDE